MAAAGSVLLIVVSAALAASLYQAAGRKVQVLAVSRTIAQGEVITLSDLRVVGESPAKGVSMLPISAEQRVIGHRAAATVPAGSLLVQDDLSLGPLIPPGDAVIGLSLKSGQLPAGGVAPGDTVSVVFSGPPGQPISELVSGNGAVGATTQAVPGLPSGSDGGITTPGATQPGVVLANDALVSDVAVPEASGSSVQQLVSIEVPGSIAGLIATAAAAGQIALVLVPPMPAASGSS